MLVERGEELVGVGVDAEVEHLEAGALEHHRDEVLADVVDVALHGADHDLADRLDAGLREQRAQDRHAGLHRVGGEQHLGHEQDAVAEVDADDAHALDERLVQDVVGGPAAAEQEVGALGDLVGHAVVEIVVHLGDERVVGEAGEIDLARLGVVGHDGEGNPRCGKDPRSGKGTDSRGGPSPRLRRDHEHGALRGAHEAAFVLHVDADDRGALGQRDDLGRGRRARRS